jgi:predicted dehydrogenase
MELPVDDVTERDWQTAEDPGTVRVAMVELGWWTRTEAVPAVEESAFCETTVLVSGSKEKAQDSTGLAESIEHGLTYEEFHDGAAAAAYDAVYICTPNARHLPFVETAAALGKDVLCEKPMEATVPRAREIDPAFFNSQDRGFRVSAGEERWEVDFEQVNQMTEEFDYFAHCLLTDTPVYPDAEHGFVDMCVMTAIYEAADRTEMVDVSVD